MRPALRELIEAQAAGVTAARPMIEATGGEVPTRERLSMSDKRLAVRVFEDLQHGLQAFRCARSPENKLLVASTLTGAFRHSPRER